MEYYEFPNVNLSSFRFLDDDFNLRARPRLIMFRSLEKLVSTMSRVSDSYVKCLGNFKAIQLRLNLKIIDLIMHGFLYNWIGRLFLPSAWLGHSLIFYNFKAIHLKLIKFDENMVLWLVNQNFEKNQVLMYHFSSNACLRKLNLNLREKKSWFSNACNFLRKTFSNLLKHELYFN